MSREAHVRFCESAAVKLRRATRPVAESFFASLRKELTNRVIFLSRDAARSNVFEYIEAFYNRVRRHSTINYKSPNDFERELSNTHAA